MIKYINKIAMLAFTIFFISCAANNTTKGVKTLTNERGETFTFHGDGRASVEYNDGNGKPVRLGDYPTNKNDPSESDKVQLYKEGDKKCVYVGNMGLKGGGKLIDAVKSANVNQVNSVLNHPNVNLCETEKDSKDHPLLIAVKLDYYSIVKQILKHKHAYIVVDLPGDERYTPLTHSILNHNVEMAKVLLDEGADANNFNRWGIMPLHIAVFSSHPGMIELILNRRGKITQEILKADKKGIIKRIVKRNNTNLTWATEKLKALTLK